MNSRTVLLATFTAASLLACGSGGDDGGEARPASSVVITPPEAHVSPGETLSLTATVPGNATSAVTWSVLEQDGGTIDASGRYTAPLASGVYRVVATSLEEPTKSAIAEVIVGDVLVDAAVPQGDSGIPEHRTTRWQPGVPGGVPSRTTVCATISAATYGNGSTDATAAIQNAINACPANQVVYLPAGTYRISSTINLNRAVVLRGAGANSTTLQRSPSGAGVMIGNWTNLGTGVNLAADAPKGATTLTVADGSPFAVGDIVHLDQLDDPAVVQGTTCVWMKRGSEGAWRSIGQMVEITGKSGNTLTLASPLHWTFTTGLRAQLVPLSVKPTRNAGLEDLRITGASGHGVNVLYAAYSWIKGVETDKVDGIHVTLAGTYRFILRDSYAHHSMRYAYGGGSYGYSLESAASDNLVENNIVYYMNKPIQFRNSGGGNVVAYNYVDDSWSQPDSSGNFTFQELSIDSHCAFSHMELVEGNYAPHMGVATTWGNAGSITYFRNQATGVFRTITSTGAIANLAAIQLDARVSDMNVVGNVLGAPGQSGAAYETTDGQTCGNRVPFVYRLNYDSAGGFCTFPSPMDSRASNTLLRHGNFDYVTSSVQWSPSIPQDLPPSLYLTSRPAFFGSNAWPWVDPTSASRVHALPAKARFDAGRPNG
jgi:hypothetical protein